MQGAHKRTHGDTGANEIERRHRRRVYKSDTVAGGAQESKRRNVRRFAKESIHSLQ